MPGVRCSASERVAASIQPKSGSHVASFDEERHDDDDGVGLGDRVGVVGGRAQAAGRDELGELLLQVRLARERLGAGVDEVDDGLVHVDTDDLVALIGELHSEGEADLSEGHDGDTHGFESNPRRTSRIGRVAGPRRYPRAGEPRRGREPQGRLACGDAPTSVAGSSAAGVANRRRAADPGVDDLARRRPGSTIADDQRAVGARQHIDARGAGPDARPVHTSASACRSPAEPARRRR